MGKKLYVGNLSYNTEENTLQSLFSTYGEVVSVNLITDRASGRPKGFGFIEMTTEEGAQAAISGLNGHSVDGREITVAEARPQPERSGDRRGGGGGGGGRYDRRSGGSSGGGRSRW
jgi:cold-inducible RNA-binding protein